MANQADMLHNPLGAYDLHVLKFIITNRVVDFALYGADVNALRSVLF